MLLRRAWRRYGLTLAFLLSACGCGSSHEWSVERAESIHVVRGYTLRGVTCRRLEQAFACSGALGRGVHAVVVTYDVHPHRAGYSLTNVRFRAFGVP